MANRRERFKKLYPKRLKNAVWNIQFVIKDGAIYYPETLLKSAEGMIGPQGPDDHHTWELHIEPLRPAIPHR